MTAKAVASQELHSAVIPILHFLTPLTNPSAFDVNMAIDAGFRLATYSHLKLSDITSLTQDAMFSRSPDRASRTCIFIGGREVTLALEMFEAVKKTLQPPFIVSAFVDPNGAFTTAAAMVAVIENKLVKLNRKLNGAKLVIFAAKGGVGFIAGILASMMGAKVQLIAHNAVALKTITDRLAFFSESLSIKVGQIDCAIGDSEDHRSAILNDAELVIAAGPAGVQILSQRELQQASSLLIALDVNAVFPLGLEGVDLMADGIPITGHSRAIGVGALAVGGIKYRCQNAMLQQLATTDKPLHLDFLSAFKMAQEIVATAVPK